MANVKKMWQEWKERTGSNESLRVFAKSELTRLEFRCPSILSDKALIDEWSDKVYALKTWLGSK